MLWRLFWPWWYGWVWNKAQEKQQESVIAGALILWLCLRLALVMDWVSFYETLNLLYYWLYMMAIYFLCSGWEKVPMSDDYQKVAIRACIKL